MWHDASFSKQKIITVDHTKVQATLANFPMLVSVAISTTNTSGYDTKFYLEDGTALDHEIDTYNSTTKEFVAWVRIPSLSHTVDTVIYLYYGKDGVVTDPSTTAVWDANYKSIYHMNDTTSAVIHDSINNNPGIKIGGYVDSAVAHGEGANAFYGGCAISGTKLCFAPYNSDHIGLYNPVTATYTAGPLHGEGDGAFADGVFVSTATVVLVPAESDYIGLYNSDTNTYTRGPAHGEGYAAFVGGVTVSSEKIVFVPYDSNYVGLYNPTTNTYTRGPAHGEGDRAFVGGVYVSETLVVLVPYNADYVGLYNPTANTYTRGPAITALNGAYRGGVYVSPTSVLLIPFAKDSLRNYNPVTNTLSTLVQTGYMPTDGSQWSGGVLSDDGKFVILSPFGQDYVGIYNLDMSTYGNARIPGTGNYTYGGVIKVANETYIFIPLGSPNICRMVFKRPSEVSGKIGKAQEFTAGGYSQIALGNTITTSQTVNATISFWGRKSNDYQAFYGIGNLWGNYQGFSSIWAESVKFTFSYDSNVAGNKSTIDSVLNHSLHYITLTIDTVSEANFNTAYAYVDGNLIGSVRYACATTGNQFGARIGGTAEGYYTFPIECWQLVGTMDEFRHSDKLRDADWIKTEYNNQNSPSTFYSVSEEEWHDSSYYYRKRVHVGRGLVESTQTNFPVLISVTDTDLKSYANGGKLRHSSGYDVKFYLEDGTALDHEIDTYDNSTGQFVAWVRIPYLLQACDTEVYMYYGNADVTSDPSTTDVWDENYVAVYHMNDVTTSSIKDSTSNDNNGTKKGANEPIQATGKVGKGQSFDASNDYIAFSTIAPDTMTVSGWYYFNSIAFRRWLFTAYGAINTMQIEPSNKFLYCGNADYFPKAMTAGVWMYLVWTIPTRTDNTGSKMIYDGSSVYNIILQGGASSWGTFNSMGRDVESFNGTQDEIRFSNIIRGNDWIKTEYNNQNSPSTFVTFGSAETLGDGAFVKGRRATGTFILSTTTQCIDDMALRTSDGAVAGFVLVNTSDPKASPIRIKTGTAIRALREVD